MKGVWSKERWAGLRLRRRSPNRSWSVDRSHVLSLLKSSSVKKKWGEQKRDIELKKLKVQGYKTRQSQKKLSRLIVRSLWLVLHGES